MSDGSWVSSAPTILAGFHRFTVPSTRPPARTPYCQRQHRMGAGCRGSAPWLGETQAGAASRRDGAPAFLGSHSPRDSRPGGGNAQSWPQPPRPEASPAWRSPGPRGRAAKVQGAACEAPTTQDSDTGTGHTSRHAVVLKLRSMAPAMVPTARRGAVGLCRRQGTRQGGEHQAMWHNNKACSCWARVQGARTRRRWCHISPLS